MKFIKYADDIFTIAGILILLGNTYYINWIIANYMLAIILMVVGVAFAKKN